MLYLTLDPNKPGELDRLSTITSLLVRYHSPGCGHCVAMKEEWSALKNHKKLKDKDITVIDVESSLTPQIKHKSARLPESQGVPTIVFIQGDKVKEHKGAREADAMADFAIEQMTQGGGGKRKGTKRKSRKKSKKIKSIKRKPIIKGTRNIRNKRLMKKKRKTNKRRRNNKKRKSISAKKSKKRRSRRKRKGSKEGGGENQPHRLPSSNEEEQQPETRHVHPIENIIAVEPKPSRAAARRERERYRSKKGKFGFGM